MLQIATELSPKSETEPVPRGTFNLALKIGISLPKSGRLKTLVIDRIDSIGHACHLASG